MSDPCRTAMAKTYVELRTFIETKTRDTAFTWDFFPGTTNPEDIYNYTSSKLFLAANIGFISAHPIPLVNEVLYNVDRSFYVHPRSGYKNIPGPTLVDWWGSGDVIGTVITKLQLLNATLAAKMEMILKLGGAKARDRFVINLTGLRLYINSKLVITAKTNSGKILEIIPLIPESVVECYSGFNRQALRTMAMHGTPEHDRAVAQYTIKQYRKRKPFFDFLSLRADDETEQYTCMLKVRGMHPFISSPDDLMLFLGEPRNLFDGCANPPTFSTLVANETKRLISSKWVPSPDEYATAAPPPPLHRSCCICMARAPAVVCVPCGHYVLCRECSAASFTGNDRKCPRCHVVTTSMVTVLM